MKKLALILGLFLISCNNNEAGKQANEDDGMTTFYFIRHAEKEKNQGSDPQLTPQGEQRANGWVNYFFLKDVDHVISSDTKRTRATAAPLARSKKLETQIYDVSSINGKALLEQYRGKTVALFGHSNTINTYANDLQKDSVYTSLSDADYDTFFIVKIDENGTTNAVAETLELIQQ